MISQSISEKPDPSFSFTIRRFPHLEKRLRGTGDVFQILYIQHGLGKKLLNTSGSAKASLIIIPPHTEKSNAPIKGVDSYSIAVGGRFLEQIEVGCWENNIHKLLSIDKDMLYFPFTGEQSSEMHALFSRMHTEYTNRRPGFQTVIRLKFTELLISLYRVERDRDPSALRRAPTPNINDIISYIEKNYAEYITLGGLSELCGLNPSYISRLFKESTGMPLFEYLNRIRVQKACLLLKRTEMSIIDVAYTVGYNNVSFFNRYFRRIMRLSPREYRNLIKK